MPATIDRITRLNDRLVVEARRQGIPLLNRLVARHDPQYVHFAVLWTASGRWVANVTSARQAGFAVKRYYLGLTAGRGV